MINIIQIGEPRKINNSNKATAVKMSVEHTPPLLSFIRSGVCPLKTFGWFSRRVWRTKLTFGGGGQHQKLF